MHPSQPIGVFDSGLGGLSVVQTLRQLLPHENIIYYGDSANAPYGNKTTEQVNTRSMAIVEHLLTLDCKAIVIACNTATSAAAEMLRQRYNDLIVVGMEPAIKLALRAFDEGDIIVLATEMTLREAKFNALIQTLGAERRIIKCPAPQLVDYVEQMIDDRALLYKQLATLLPTRHPSQRALVLGCTHFIFLKDLIADYYHRDIAIFDGNRGTTKHLAQQLSAKKLLNHSNQAAKLTILNSAGESMVQKSCQIIKP